MQLLTLQMISIRYHDNNITQFILRYINTEQTFII